MTDAEKSLDTLANTPVTRGGVQLYPDDVCPAAFAALRAVLALRKPTAASVRAAILAALETP